MAQNMIRFLINLAVYLLFHLSQVLNVRGMQQ